MSSYLSSILSVGIISFICETVAASKSKSSMKKVLGFITSLCVFASVALPFFSAVKSMGTSLDARTEQQEDFDEGVFYRQVEIEFEDEIRKNIFNEFGILLENISINLSVIDSEITISRISIYLSGDFLDMSEQIKEHLYSICPKDTKITITEMYDE